MTRQALHRLSGRLPLVLSALALAVVVAALTLGDERHAPDEGAAAHLFQLLIAAQAPLMLLFVLTADRSRWRREAAQLALLVGAVGLALAPVAWFRL